VNFGKGRTFVVITDRDERRSLRPGLPEADLDTRTVLRQNLIRARGNPITMGDKSRNMEITVIFSAQRYLSWCIIKKGDYNKEINNPKTKIEGMWIDKLNIYRSFRRGLIHHDAGTGACAIIFLYVTSVNIWQ
jgi:hypothetical protein